MIDALHEESEQKIKSEDGFPVPDHPGDNLDPMDFLEGDANDVDEQNNDNEIAENNDANHTTSSSDNNLVQIKSEIISDKNNKKKKSEKRKKESYSAETNVSICLSVCLLTLDFSFLDNAPNYLASWCIIQKGITFFRYNVTSVVIKWSIVKSNYI